jgi:hypothetical protein
MESTLSHFLRTYNKIKPNPFLNKKFFVSAIETDKNFKTYLVDNISISFKNLNCKIQANNNFILAAYLILSIEDNAFGFDPESTLYINNEKILYNKNADITEKFKKIENKIENDIFELKYSNTEDGRDAFNYNRSLAWFIIDEHHDDDFYLNKLLNDPTNV